MFCITFLEGLVNDIENKNQSARNNFVLLKYCIMLNISLTKTKQNAQEVHHMFLNTMPK